jgi:DNA polymerase-3 subunit delta'
MYFKDIIGRDGWKERLLASVREGFIPHAQLFSGREGVGAFELALAYARYLHCSNRRPDDACGVCPNCLQFNKWAHPDMHFVFPIINKKGNREALCDDFLPEWRAYLSATPCATLSGWLEKIAADNAQGLIYARESDAIVRKLNLRAYESDYKILFLWLPEKMHEVAANKLLKLLEEPPEKTVFLLVSEEPERLLTTIRSRVQNRPVPPMEAADLTQLLQAKHPMPNEACSLVVRLAKGSYSEALRIIDATHENEAGLELFMAIMRNAWTRDIRNMRRLGDQFAALGRDRQKAFLAYAQRMMRENFLLRLQMPDINYLNRKEGEFADKFSRYIHEANIVDFMNELALAERHIEANVNPRMVFFDLSMKMAVLLKKQA